MMRDKEGCVLCYIFHYEHEEVRVTMEAVKGIQGNVATTLFRQQGASRKNILMFYFKNVCVSIIRAIILNI